LGIHGVEHDILRDNMPFGRPGHAECGTYFIGYARNLWVIEQLLHNMTAITGSTFFAPSNSLLISLAD